MNAKLNSSAERLIVTVFDHLNILRHEQESGGKDRPADTARACRKVGKLQRLRYLPHFL
jgi:hypothetical protein